MYFENRGLEECTHAVQIVANLHVPQNRPVGFGLRNYTIRESTKSNNIPDPNPMPIKDGLSRKLVFFANRNTQKNMQLLDKIHTVFTAALKRFRWEQWM